MEGVKNSVYVLTFYALIKLFYEKMSFFKTCKKTNFDFKK
jgi:hypothetical protein